MKEALLLNIVNPAIGGVIIQGEKGTAKTTAVRSLTSLISANTRVIEMPLGASEDRVVGTVDLKTMMREGERRFEPGILAEADGNILYIDEINLLEDHIVDLLLDVAATGINRVERDGISYTHPSRFILVGTMNPEEGALRPQLLDRFGLFVKVESSLSREERGEVVRRRLAFEHDPQEFISSYAKEEASLRECIARAKTLYAQIAPIEDNISFVADLCSKMKVDGYRADITIMKTAATFAALDGRTEIIEEDIANAARLVLPHRVKGRPFDENELVEEMVENALDRQDDRGNGKDVERNDSKKNADSSKGGTLPQVIAPAAREPFQNIDFSRMDRQGKTDGRSAVRQQNAPRGRCVGATRNELSGKPHAYASIITQAISREGLSSGVSESNLRYQILERKSGTLIILLVDTSASMLADQRMEMAKGCALSLLHDAYLKRDKVAVISFGGMHARLCVPPTSSPALAARKLEILRTGGKTPLIEALNLASEVAYKARDMPILFVIVTDGRYSYRLAENTESQIRHFAQTVRTLQAIALVVDTEKSDIFATGMARRLADLAEAEYVRIEDMREDCLRGAIERKLC